MCSKKGTKFLRTTTTRLTLWYLGVFSILSLVVFGVVYVFLTIHLHDQTDNELMNKALEFKTLYMEEGVKALQSEFAREAASQGTGRVFFKLISATGKLLAESDMSEWNQAGMRSFETTFSQGNKISIRTISISGQRYKVRVIFVPVTDGNIIVIGITLKSDEMLLKRYRETFGTALMVMLICGGIVGWLLTRKAMAGVKRVTEIASQIGKNDFGRRVTVADEGEEIKNLVQAFNDMLERIESLLHELQQITDNIAHELRTPITRIRGIAETTLKGDGNIDEFREMAASIIDGSDNLIEMINAMLEITKTGSGDASLTIESLDIAVITGEAIDLFTPVAEDKNVHINLSKPSQPVMISGDRRKLQRAIANLLDNAIKYTPAGGEVSLSITTDKTGVRIKISDTGIGIDKKDISRIFDRFYRCDKSRSTSGSGLGLSLALAIIRAHGGNIAVKSNDTGSTFTIFLPTR